VCLQGEVELADGEVERAKASLEDAVSQAAAMGVDASDRAGCRLAPSDRARPSGIDRKFDISVRLATKSSSGTRISARSARLIEVADQVCQKVCA